MLGLIFSLDYEVYGKGEGDFEKLILEPTEQLLLLFNRYGAKLSIMAEVAEILALNRHEKFEYIGKKIESQLKRALSEGHDVQLHLHPQWFKGKYDIGKWILNYDEYSLAHLPKEKILKYIKIGKDYLESIGKEIKSDYECIAFRAGNWLMQPSKNIVESLEEAGFLYDTSVFKWGRMQVNFGLHKFSLDYTKAYSHLLPWKMDPLDINKRANRDGLSEIPIFTRKVFITSMLTPKRIALLKESEKPEEKISADGTLTDKIRRKISKFKLFYPKKFDFCRMTFKELKSYIDYAIKKCADSQDLIPVVSIGHSKDFLNDDAIDRFFEYISSQYENRFLYTTFADLKSVYY